MKKIIIDCDNTFGVEGCDLDDGLAIIYALGTGKCNLLAVTTTFGNNVLEVVYPNTVFFLNEIDMRSIPVYLGHVEDPKQNKAAKYLVEITKQHPGEISIVGLGSLTNLYHAYLLDPAFFGRVAELSFMGGITAPLEIMGKVLDELNFSCNSTASLAVLKEGKNIKIATGNVCLDALFTKTRFCALNDSEVPFLRWLCVQGQYWFDRENTVFGHDGIYKWDIYATAALLHPELFESNSTIITPDEHSIKKGNLLGSGIAVTVDIPILKDADKYIEHVYKCYAKFAQLHS